MTKKIRIHSYDHSTKTLTEIMDNLDIDYKLVYQDHTTLHKFDVSEDDFNLIRLTKDKAFRKKKNADYYIVSSTLEA